MSEQDGRLTTAKKEILDLKGSSNVLSEKLANEQRIVDEKTKRITELEVKIRQLGMCFRVFCVWLVCVCMYVFMCVC